MYAINTISAWIAGLLLVLSLTTQAQPGADPAVTSRALAPNPLQGVGSTFTLSFRIGNNGAVAISGSGNNNANRMQFGICLAKASPSPASAAALSGPLLNYFDVVYNASSNCFEGRQKQNVAIPPTTVFSLSIAAIVTSASTSTLVADVGASCNIAPNAASNPQPSDNDFASIYTYTINGPMPVSLIDFDAQLQTDRSVLVQWHTSWERNNKGYIIERSKDLINFEEIGQVVDVAGTSNSVNTYRFVDSAPYKGTSYYRLRQVDTDGKSQVFPAKSVIVDGNYSVYPNPIVNGYFTVMLDEPLQAALHLYNEAGSEITINRSTTTDTSVKLIPDSPLSSGIYILTVNERGTTRKYRLLVQP
jgi:hypothetical protein